MWFMSARSHRIAISTYGFAMFTVEMIAEPMRIINSTMIVEAS